MTLNKPKQKRIYSGEDEEEDFNNCINDHCQEITHHKSGLCEKCRTYMCPICKAGFISVKDIRNIREPICSSCRRKRKKDYYG